MPVAGEKAEGELLAAGSNGHQRRNSIGWSEGRGEGEGTEGTRDDGVIPVARNDWV